MAALRERTSFLKLIDGEVRDFDKDGGWVDVVETLDGGAEISPDMEMLDFLDKIYARSLERAEELGEFSVEVHDEKVIFKDKEGKVIPFNTVMEILFD